METIEWYGLYNESWQGEIVPEAFSHPAKFSRALIRQIYQHMIDRGYIAPGDHIADPFGGVGLGALDAMRHGLHWHGCELEPRFVELGNQNLGLWQARYSGWFANWGTAVLHQGDSRQLAQVIETVGGCVSSPPYGDAISNETSGIDWGKSGRLDRTKPSSGRNNTMTDGVTSYGSTPGNIGNDNGESFWTAARDIVAQVYQVLKPGGYAAFVCGDFVRNKQRVNFGQQWLELCEAVGFEAAEWIIAWKTEHHGTQLDIFGNGHAKQVDRVSFFRRLANEKNPDAAILNEDVIIVRKPLT